MTSREIEKSRAPGRGIGFVPLNAVDKSGSQTIPQTPVKEQALWLNLDAIREMAEMIESLAVSTRLAAWRGSPEACGVHLRQMRLALIEAISIFKEIEGSQ
jgi:hypothetical protein